MKEEEEEEEAAMEGSFKDHLDDAHWLHVCAERRPSSMCILEKAESSERWERMERRKGAGVSVEDEWLAWKPPPPHPPA